MEKEVITLVANSEKLLYCGRFHSNANGEVIGNWAGISVTIKFIGTSLKVTMDANDNYFNVFIDNKLYCVLDCEHDNCGEYIIAQDLPHQEHEVTIFKRTEAISGTVLFKNFTIEGNPSLGCSFLKCSKKFSSKIEFIGDSITAGYGIEDNNELNGYNHSTSNNFLAYGCLTAQKMNADYRTVAHSGKGIFQNYEQDHFETIPQIYKNMLMHQDITINPKEWIPDYIVINLGTNDFAIAPPAPALFQKAYYSFLMELVLMYPETKIVCCIGPTLNDNWPIDPGTGESYPSLSICSNLVRQTVEVANHHGYKNIHFFTLSNKSSEFGFGADYHPCIKQAEINAQELFEFIKEI